MKLWILCLAVLPFVMGGNLEAMMKDFDLDKMMGKFEGELGLGDKGGDKGGDHGGDKGGDQGGDHGEDKDEEEEKKDLMGDFKHWMKEQQKPEEDTEDFVKKLKDNMLNFKQYMKAKEFQKMLQKKAEAEAHKKEMMMELKEKLAHKYEEAQHEFKDYKKEFKFGLVEKLLSFCSCETDVRSVFHRIEEGTFAMPAPEETGGAFSNATTVINQTSCVNGSCTTNVTVINNVIEEARRRIDGVDIPSVIDDVKALKELDPKEQFQYGFKFLLKVVCGAAKNYIAQMSELETDVLFLKEQMWNGTNTNGTSNNGTMTPP